MLYRVLLNVTAKFNSNGTYEKTMQNLVWEPLDIMKNISIFEEFLIAWHSLRHPLGKDELSGIWLREIEPYAKALSGLFLEDLDVNELINIELEKLRVGIIIEHMYSALSTVSGIGETNASKLLHLRLPNLFVMTDTNVRELFKKLRREEFFEPYAYAFNFLPFVKSKINEAIDELCEDKRLNRQQAIDFLRNVHGRSRSLAKLMDECYYVLAHELETFPKNYCFSLMEWRSRK